MVLESPQNAEEGCVYYEQFCVRDAPYKLGKCCYTLIYKLLVIKILSFADIISCFLLRVSADIFFMLIKCIQENLLILFSLYTVIETIVFFNKIMMLKVILTVSHQLEANHELYAHK